MKVVVFIYGIFLLVSVLVILIIFNMIFLVSFVVILIIVGFKLVKFFLFKEMYVQGSKQFILFIVMIIGIFFIDLFIGIGIGLVVVIFYIFLNNYKMFYFVEDKCKDKGVIYFELVEDVFFFNKVSILLSLKKLFVNSKVVIDVS